MTALADLFPETPRILYARSPLTQVICQVRFPTILRVESEPPAAFQEVVRDAFPIFERQAVLSAIPQLPLDLSRLMGLAAPASAYLFKNEAGDSSIALLAHELTFSTSSYGRWEVFRKVLAQALSALVELYKPSFYLRVGLRYQNIIHKNNLSLSGVPWTELIRSEMLGEYAAPAWLESATEVRRQTTLKTDTGSLLFQHGLALPGDPTSYVVDIDLFTEKKTETADAEGFLDELHSYASRAFRWSVTDRLHDAMEPHDLDADDARRVA